MYIEPLGEHLAPDAASGLLQFHHRFIMEM
jgi:hypothetical protein